MANQVHSIVFSPREELLWAGAESGALYAMALPPLLTYSSVRAHALPLADLAPLMDGVVSVSANAMRYHASGGLERTTLVEALAVCIWRSLLHSSSAHPPSAALLHCACYACYA